MIKQTSTNPIANLLIIAAGVVVIGVSVVLGFFASVVLATAVTLAAADQGIRIWWLTRPLKKQPGGAAGSPQATGVIEGEYKVVDTDGDEA